MTGEFLINGVNFKDIMDDADRTKAALAIEQREHGITRTQLETLQTELKDAQTRLALDAAFLDANDECIKELNDELDTERRLNNAALKPSQTVQAEDARDALACMAEEVLVLKADKIELKKVVERRNERIGCILRDISILQDSAETQARHMQQVDTARLAAEEKCIEQRKGIEALKSGEDLWICPSADDCTHTKCPDKKQHEHNDRCGIICTASATVCVKINTCKECATLREEIINRDAVILEQERKADRAERIMHDAWGELKELRECVITRKNTTRQRPSIVAIMIDGDTGSNLDNMDGMP